MSSKHIPRHPPNPYPILSRYRGRGGWGSRAYTPASLFQAVLVQKRLCLGRSCSEVVAAADAADAFGPFERGVGGGRHIRHPQEETLSTAHQDGVAPEAIWDGSRRG